MEIKIERDTFSKEEIWVSVTHNGYSWPSIHLHDLGELCQLRDAIGEFIMIETQNDMMENIQDADAIADIQHIASNLDEMRTILQEKQDE